MDRRVKERLVGAAVLMAAAIILIPEMLSGPRRGETTVSSHTATHTSNQGSTGGDGSFKTYTIDLNRSPGTPATISVEEQAPPPEDPLPADVESAPKAAAPEGQSPSANSANGTQAYPESTNAERTPPQRVATAPPRPASPQAQQQTPPAREASSTPAVGSTQSVPTSRDKSTAKSTEWAVQLGSFSSKATAERMVKDLSGSGHDAFVMPVQSGANTLYRVRVGPFADRAAANDALVTIRKRVANAAVVAHP